MPVHVITDSGCDLPDELVTKWNIRVVPLSIRFGAEELLDREQLSTDAFWERLREATDLPETAAPAPGRFVDAFRAAAQAGADAIVCINLSSALSATMQSAELAARDVANEIPVTVIDSQQVSMGLGSLVLTAAELAAEGADAATIEATVLAARSRTRLFGALDTLEFLRKGGRIGGAQALLGSMLSIKPLIEVRNGTVEEAGKVRTRSKALQALVDHVRAQPVESVAVLHGASPDLDVLLDLLDPIVPRSEILVGTVGPTIGTHAGPGVIGVTFRVAEPS
jgi:DegV family protein with EDD domain